MKCSKCGFDAPDSMKFCGMCGATLVKVCPSCNAENPLSYRFCGMCGAPFPGMELARAAMPQESGFRVNGEVDAVPQLFELEGERKVVTIVITDVTGSTKLLEQMGNESWVELMNRILNNQEGQVHRFGGVVDQFRGDGMVAFFGADEAHEDDPERAVLAAFAMLQAVHEIEQELNQQADLKLQLRIGVNTGEVIVGSKGVKRQHQDEIAMGLGITVAARLEVMAEPGTILVSENTYRLVKDQFEWQPIGDISVRGLSRPIAVYRPTALKPMVEYKPPNVGLDFSTPIIGKEREFDLMKQTVKELGEGRGGILLLSAETGMGKSFIINRLRQYFVHQEDLLSNVPLDQKKVTPVFYQGRCRSFSNTWPYSMWIDLLHDWLGVNEISSGKQAVHDILYQRCQELWEEEFRSYYPYLATLLSVPLEEEYSGKVRYLDAAGLSEQFHWALRGWVEAVATQGPLVFIFTDIQWADNPSLEALKLNLSLVEGAYAGEVRMDGERGYRRHPVLWLLSMRPDRDSPAWEFRYYLETQYPHRLKMVTLSHLNQHQGEKFLNSLLGTGVLPEETLSMIVRNSEGNPYYIVEYVRSLVETGVIVQDYEAGKWKFTRAITSLEIPGNLQQLFQARIDQLPPETRMVLQLAAVIGPVFWYNVLQYLVTETPGFNFSLTDCLAMLLRENLIRERNQVSILGMEYVFSSGMVRETVYESLLNTQRVTVHIKTAIFLEEHAGLENSRQYDRLIAYHYGRGGNTRKELFFTLQAAEAARQVYANTEALGHCHRALEILEDMEASTSDEGQLYALRTQKFDALKMRQSLNYIVGDIEAGDADGHALLPLAEQMGDDPAWLVDALLVQPEVTRHENRQELPEGLEKAKRALSLARQMGDRYRELYSMMAVALLSHNTGDPQAIEIGRQAFEIARELGDTQMQVDLLLSLRDAYGMDDISRSDRYLKEALDICYESKDRLTELRLLAAMGDEMERQGDYYRLLVEIHQKRLEISREIGYRLEEGFAQMYCAQIQGLYLGDYKNALSSAEESFKLTSRLTQSLFPLLRVAQLQAMMGQFAESQKSLDMAQPYAERGISEVGRAGLWLVQAILCNLIGDQANRQKALEACGKVWKLGDQKLVSRQYIMAASCEACKTYLSMAETTEKPEEKQNYRRRALEASTGAIDIYRQFGFVQVIECSSEEILYNHSQVLAANDLIQESRQLMEQSYNEMMRKLDLIPIESSYRKTYLENIEIHRRINAEYKQTKKSTRRNKAARKAADVVAAPDAKISGE